MNRMQEIELRLTAILETIETKGAELSADELTALEAEVVALKSERASLKAAQEQRQRLLSDIAEGREAPTAARKFPAPAAAPAQPDADDAGDPRATMAYRRAFMAYVLRGTPIPAQLRANQITLTGDVGVAIPTTTLDTIINRMQAVGMILNAVTRTAYKGGLAVAASTVKPVASWVAEGAGSDTQKMPLGSFTFAYHKLRCAVAVSLEVDTMALPAFESVMVDNIVEAMTKALEQAIVSGDGTGKPKGILAETPATGQALQSAALSYQDLIGAEAALPQAYESGAAWCMSKKTFMGYYGLTDDMGQPIARVNYGLAGVPERTILGRPVIVCDYLPSFASADLAAVFAFLFDFRDYVLNTNYEIGLKKYEDNETDDQVTKAIMLVDGKAVDLGSLVTIAKSA